MQRFFYTAGLDLETGAASVKTDELAQDSKDVGEASSNETESHSNGPNSEEAAKENNGEKALVKVDNNTTHSRTRTKSERDEEQFELEPEMKERIATELMMVS